MSAFTFYVNTASAGGDGTTNGVTGATAAYASGATFLAAEATDLPTDGNNYVILMDGAGGNDTTRMDVDGFTTGDGYGLVFRQNPAGSSYSLKYSDANAPLILREDYVEIDGIEVFNTQVNSQKAIDLTSGSKTSGDNLIVIKNSHVASTFDKSNGYLIDAGESNLVLEIINTTAACVSRFIECRGAAQVDIDYCSVLLHGNYLGLVGTSETTTRNTYIGHTGTDTAQCFWTGGSAPSGSNNVSSDASATTDYTSSLINKEASDQFVSVTAGSEDFALKTGTPAIEEAATPIAGITTDQIGTTRDASTPDVGARERVGGGGGTFKPYWALNRSSIINSGIS
jgi:hypothetical protein